MTRQSINVGKALDIVSSQLKQLVVREQSYLGFVIREDEVFWSSPDAGFKFDLSFFATIPETQL